MSFTKGYIRRQLWNNVEWLERGILAIDARQTPDEQAARTTRYDNDRGWNAADAKMGGYMANYIRNSKAAPGYKLTGSWISKAREMMNKYAGQLTRIANRERVAA